MGIAGLVLVVFGLICAAIISSEDFLISLTHLALGIVLILAFLIAGGLGRLRSSAAKRMAGFSASVLIYTALFLAVLALVNLFAKKHEFVRYDSTEEKIYTLASQTEAVIEKLTAPLELRAFYLGGKIDDPKTQDLLDRFVAKSAFISLQVLDPDKQPSLVEKYGINDNRTLHLSYKLESGERESKVSHGISEQDLVNAIIKLNRGEAKTIYYITGHGEPALDDQGEQGYLFLKEAVSGENYRLQELTIGVNGNIPADAAALILAHPQRALLPAERNALDTYLASGGRAIFLNQVKSTDDIAELARPLGIAVGNDVIVEPVVQLFSGPSLGVQPMITAFGKHEITDRERPKQGIHLGLTSSVLRITPVAKGARVIELALSGKGSWAEKNLGDLFSDSPQAQQDSDDLAGPVSVAVAYQKAIAVPEGAAADSNPKEARVVVFGNADFVNNQSIRQLFNQDFFLNSLNWVVGEEDAIAIRSGSMRVSTKEISADAFRSMFLFGAIYIPELLLLLGLYIWWLRKSHG